MKLSVVVMAHPRRRSQVAELMSHLPRAKVVWDQVNSCWDTGRRSLLAHDRASDWAITVQDDALPCSDFIEGVRLALSHVDQPRPVAFYFGQALAAKLGVTRHGPVWVEAQGPWSGVALALPTKDLTDIVASGNACKDTRRRYVDSYDKRIARFYGNRGLKCWYSVPSLVDHRNGLSMMAIKRNGRRNSFRFIGQKASALSVDWKSAEVLSV